MRTPGHECKPPHRTRSAHGGVDPTAPSAPLTELSVRAVTSPSGGQLPTPVGNAVGTGHGRLPGGERDGRPQGSIRVPVPRLVRPEGKPTPHGFHAPGCVPCFPVAGAWPSASPGKVTPSRRGAVNSGTSHRPRERLVLTPLSPVTTSLPLWTV